MGAGRRDCTWGVGQPGGSRGPAKTRLCWLLNLVCHLSFFIWPSACTPHAPQGGSCPERCGIKEPGAQVPWQPGPCPVGPAPSVPGADRLVSRRGEGGEDGAARVPCPLPGWAPATACSLSGTLPAVRNRRFTPYLFSHSCFPLPPVFCQKDPGRLTALSSGPSRLPLLATQAQAAARGPPKPKTWAESAQTALCELHALL